MKQPSSPSLKQLLAPISSLRLTVVLIALSMLLIYAGTWAQIDHGIWQVQKQYFHSFFTWISFATFLPRPKPGELKVPGGFPMLGGYAIGLLLLINLISAHALRFKATWKDLILIPAAALSIAIAWMLPVTNFWALVSLLVFAPLPLLLAVAPLHGKRTGVILIHLGLIALLLGEGITSGLAVESQMTINEGSSASYSQDIRTVELAIVDPSSADHDSVIVIPESRLTKGAVIQHSAMPVEAHLDEYFPNAMILGPMQAGKRADSRATAGDGMGITAAPEAASTGDAIDMPAGYVTLSAGGQKLGTWLVSALIDQSRRPVFPPQEFAVGDKKYLLQLRFKRLYKPYTIYLKDFRFDRYLGTNEAKDFSSFVRFVDPTHNVDRDVRIWMNNPLRYRGETLYQADWIKETERGTVLQVVQNPGWLMPYFACAIGALGMLIHFGMHLTKFMRKTLSSGAGDAIPSRVGLPERLVLQSRWVRLLHRSPFAFVLAIYLISLAYILRPVGPRTDFDLKTFGTLPVSHEGRIQPLDSLARNSIKVISGRESAVDADDKRLSATQWLADTFGQPEKAAAYPIFRIDSKDVLGMLNLDAARKRFSLKEVLASRDKLQEQLDRAHQVAPKDRDLFQKKTIELGEKLTVYMKLAQMESLFLIPPLAAGQVWQPLSTAMHGGAAQEASPAARTYMNLVAAYHGNEPDRFNREAATFAAQVRTALPQADEKIKFEALFNRIDPFMQCIALYLVAFLLACLSW
ncbi:MAG: cytochrome c biogenesis protein ResB, partial [Tepidisphaeraceae bacterium]